MDVLVNSSGEVVEMIVATLMSMNEVVSNKDYDVDNFSKLQLHGIVKSYVTNLKKDCLTEFISGINATV